MINKEGLTDLRINGINLTDNEDWPVALIAGSRRTLRHLGIGNELQLADDYRVRSRGHAVDMQDLENAVKKLCKIRDGTDDVNFDLEDLALCTLDVNAFFGGSLGGGIDFKNLNSLAIESCHGLPHAFQLLLGPDAFPQKPIELLRLKAFYLRHETSNVPFQEHLSWFLASLSGLECLQVLLEGSTEAVNLPRILRVHGQTLRILVWDKRSGPRISTDRSTSVIDNSRFRHLIEACHYGLATSHVYPRTPLCGIVKP